MILCAIGLAEGNGAVIVDASTGLPLPIAPLSFHDEEDAKAFLAWLGEPCGNIHHLRDLVRRWPSERPPRTGEQRAADVRDFDRFERAIGREF